LGDGLKQFPVVKTSVFAFSVEGTCGFSFFPVARGGLFLAGWTEQQTGR